ncbi:phage terminase small subunit [Raoultella ornithinolytica]|uniref:phage terminase small subunit n=1 Tax=Raoultella ornithinolytica TaxID=54291 RepID=UPI000B4DE1F9|nr:phage terminase small subunit [Raoultella ornithinolytica]MDL4584890.1 phage terminase small subunit [Raoultella ornithinolytica]OWP39796.1 terminase [Raoultella ornithinolytica]HDT6598776.1 terminase [Raoultella ornithinolytica]
MLTPAQRHFQQVMAERRGGSDQRDAETRTAHEQILFRLHMHKSSLSQIQSRQAKAAVKASILPEFEGWIDGTIEGDSGRADPVITTLMVWAVDCSDYALALRIGRYVVKHGLSMPEDNYRRPAPTVLTEEICNPILNIATTDAGAELAGYIAMLDELAEIVADSDMPDEVRAKLCKVRAFCRRNTEDTETKGEALKLFREAMSLNPGAGVKREIASLVSALKKVPQTSVTGDDAVDETSFSDAATAETPAAEKTTRTRKQAKTATGTKTAARKTAAKKTTKTATK